MSEQSSSSGIQVLENVLIKSRMEPSGIIGEVKPATAEGKTDDALHVSVEKEISKLVQASDPISPVTAVPTNEENLLSDDEEAKIILNLEVSSFSNETSIEEPNDNRENENEINKKAMEQLDQLVGKKIRQKVIPKDPLSISEVKAEQVTIKSEQSPKSPVKLHNRVLASASNANALEKDILERVTISVEKPKKILNPLAPQPSNDDLVAILEGNDEKGGDEEEHYEVVQIIGDSDMKDSDSTIVASVISKEEERQIALEQISTIPKNVRRRKRKQPIDAENSSEKSNATAMVKSLASDWSDTDKEPETKTSESPVTKKAAPKKTAEPEKKVFEPKIEPFKRTRIIKKKIIWDPDAPETQFSYASLVQSSAKKPKKVKPAPTLKKATTPPLKAKDEVNAQKGKRRSETPTMLNNKKKKLSEIDRLLGDEGAANMINSLENDKSQEKDSRPKKDQVAAGDKQERKEPVLKKRTPKPKSAAASWDYVYSQRNDDSMIIRRRSNSSYSSTTSPRRLSLEQSPANHAKNKISPGAAKVPAALVKLPSDVKVTAGSTKTTVVATRGKNFEFAKPEDKKVRKEPERVDATIVADIKKAETRESLRKSSRTPVSVELNEAQVSKPDAKVAVKADKIPDITVRKHGSVTELAIQSKLEKIKYTFTPQLMNEVVKQLEALKADTACKVVVITSAGQHFCQGVDFISLTTGTADKRKTAAVELATSVRNFLQTLASFPKPIIAGISGACAGIGVTMLPLFDIVICSDKSTFETNYAKIGQLPEGNCIINLTNNLRHNFKTKLLWMCEKYSSTEAALSGLVTKLTSPAKLQADTILYARKIATLSQQTFSSIKSQRQKADLAKLVAALAEEQKILAQQWVSPECQEKFKQYLQKDCW